MKESEVRDGLVLKVRRRFEGKPHLLLAEVDVRWTIPARMDALLVSDRLTGFEIKSDVDSLLRLPRQVQAYSAVVERAALIVAQRHFERAVTELPSWWAIYVAKTSPSGERVLISQAKRGLLNPSINPLAVTSFVGREELTIVLRAIGEKRLSGQSVDELRKLMVARLGKKRTVETVRSLMLHRPDLVHRSLSSSH